MPTYRNVWYKPIVVSATTTTVIPQSDWVEDANVTVAPGETVTLSEADAAALGDRVELVP